MKNQEILQHYQSYLSTIGLKPNTRKEKQRFIQRYINYLDELALKDTELEHIEAFITTMKALKNSTIAKRLSTLKMFYQFLEYSRLINKQLSEHFPSQKPEEVLPCNLSLSMAIKLCQPTDIELPKLETSIKTIRNQAIIEFLFSTGVRNSELRYAKLKDLSADFSECMIGTEKGGPNRVVYLGKYARTALYSYLEYKGFANQSRIIDEYREAYIFTSVGNRHLSISRLNEIVREIAVLRIGSPVSPLMLRHTFATEMLKTTRCLRSVQEMLGHARITSTVRYCHYDTADKQEAIDKYHPRNSMGID